MTVGDSDPPEPFREAAGGERGRRAFPQPQGAEFQTPKPGSETRRRRHREEAGAHREASALVSFGRNQGEVAWTLLKSNGEDASPRGPGGPVHARGPGAVTGDAGSPRGEGGGGRGSDEAGRGDGRRRRERARRRVPERRAEEQAEDCPSREGWRDVQ